RSVTGASRSLPDPAPPLVKGSKPSGPIIGSSSACSPPGGDVRGNSPPDPITGASRVAVGSASPPNRTDTGKSNPPASGTPPPSKSVTGANKSFPVPEPPLVRGSKPSGPITGSSSACSPPGGDVRGSNPSEPTTGSSRVAVGSRSPPNRSPRGKP